jgi:hypothetical protein
VDAREALAALGLPADATFPEARAAYRRLVRVAHPDVAGPAGTADAARLNQAFAVLRAQAGSLGARATAGHPEPPSAPPPPAPAPPPRPSPYEEAVQAELAAGDTLLLRAPADEAFAALLEAAGRVGDIAYVDRQLLIIEAIVRFEGGPSCSFLVTLQGRVDGTEAFCTLESLEAAPTPPVRPVVEALVAALGERP